MEQFEHLWARAHSDKANLGLLLKQVSEGKRFVENGFALKKIKNNMHYPNGISVSTVGLEHSFDHPDFQICLPMDHHKALACFNHLASQIQKGKIFEAGQTYGGHKVNGHPIQFMEVVANRAKVLRILISNRKGVMDTVRYNRQITKTHDGSHLRAVYYQPSDIGNAKDVTAFMHELFEAVSYNFHPESMFRNYTYKDSGTKVFTPKQAIQLQLLYDHCHTIKGGKAAIDKAIQSHTRVILKQAAIAKDKPFLAYLKQMNITPGDLQGKVIHEHSHQLGNIFQRKKKVMPLPGSHLPKR